MTRRLFVHVGLAKTGTTSIQNLLGCRARQRARRGIHVPTAGGGSVYAGNHHLLARESADASRHWRRLADEIARSAQPRFVISSEAFAAAGRSAPAIERLQRLAARARLEVVIVAYVRPQWQRLEAGYADAVKRGRTTAPFERYVAGRLAANADTRYDYNAVFAPFQRAFGAAVRVFPMDTALPDGLLAHFQQVLGIDVPVTLPAALAHSNARPGAKEIAVRTLVNAAAPPAGRRRLRFLAPLLDADAPFRGFRGDEIEALHERFRAANARFARDYGIDAHGVLFREPAAPAPARPQRARWQDLSAAERRRVRRYVLDRTGVDLAAGTAPANRWYVRAALARRTIGRAPRALVRRRPLRDALRAWRQILS